MQRHSLDVQTNTAENSETVRQNGETLCNHHELQCISSVLSVRGGSVSFYLPVTRL